MDNLSSQACVTLGTNGEGSERRRAQTFPRRKDEGENNPGAVVCSEMLFTSLGPTLIIWSVYRRNCGGPEANL